MAEIDREKAAQILDTAVDVLKATGWCVGSLGDTNIERVDEDGAHCAVGSIAAAASIHGVSSGRAGAYGIPQNPKGLALVALGAALNDNDLKKQRVTRWDREELRDSSKLNQVATDYIVDWNDSTLGRMTPSKGKATLIRRLRKAARSLRKSQ